jgi:hypothetical protein
MPLNKLAEVFEAQKKAIDEFVNSNVSCANCAFFKSELFGGECDALYPVGYLEKSSSMCEQHEFNSDSIYLERKLQALQNEYLDTLDLLREKEALNAAE